MPAIIHLALGSNRRHGRFGAPAGVVAAAVAALDAAGLTVVARSSVIATAPVGPSSRRYANAVVAVATDAPLPAILATLQSIERSFGRRPGRRWGARVLDLDIVAAGAAVTSGWRTAQRGLIIPHRGVATRDFVLRPLVEIAADWSHPVLHLTARQLRARLLRRRPSAAGSP